MAVNENTLTAAAGINHKQSTHCRFKIKGNAVNSSDHGPYMR